MPGDGLGLAAFLGTTGIGRGVVDKRDHGISNRVGRSMRDGLAVGPGGRGANGMRVVGVCRGPFLADDDKGWPRERRKTGLDGGILGEFPIRPGEWCEFLEKGLVYVMAEMRPVRMPGDWVFCQGLS